jgi:hypothetical protein
MLALLLAAQVTGDAERREAAMLILTPFGSSSHTGTSRIFSAASRAFEAVTDIRLVLASDAGVDVDRWMACPSDRRLTCWVRVAREARVSLLLVVTVAASIEGDRVAITMIDLDEVSGLEEDQIFERLGEVAPREVGDPDATFASVVSSDLRPFLERHGWFRSAPPGMAKACDGCEVESTIVNDALLYSGIAAIAGGGALVAASLILVAAGPRQICAGRDEASCDYVGAARSGFGADAPTPIEEANPGFPLLPVGVGLAALGASFTVGSLALDEEYWWVTVVSGVVLGSATMGIALAAE